MALLSQQNYIGTLPDFLDELKLDNEKRDEVQAMAGRFLHIRTPKESQSGSSEARNP